MFLVPKTPEKLDEAVLNERFGGRGLEVSLLAKEKTSRPGTQVPSGRLHTTTLEDEGPPDSQTVPLDPQPNGQIPGIVYVGPVWTSRSTCVIVSGKEAMCLPVPTMSLSESVVWRSDRFELHETRT